MNFEEQTVNIILNEMFTEARKTLSQSEFDEITKGYAKRIVKLFAIPRVIECLEQVNATLERHGKVDANTDLHNKIRNSL